MRVLGIDPGSQVTGWGVVEAVAGQPRRIASGVAAPTCRGPAARLGYIAGCLEQVFEEWQPVEVAMERAFVGRNAASALKLGEVRGALLALAGRRGISVVDYPPATVKVAVTGFGRAEKEAVARGVSHLLGSSFSAGDSTDALAVAICHLRHAQYAVQLGGDPDARRAAGSRWPVPLRRRVERM